MKKKILCLALCFILILSCACSKAPDNKTDTKPQEKTAELYNYEVTEEPFESMEILPSTMTHKTYANEQELFEASEMVFIGMPLDTFTDGEQHYYNYDMEEIDKDSEEQAFFYCTTRDIKVIEMIKGDKSLKTVSVADEAVVKEDENSNQKILGLPMGCRIAKKNAKYIYYLTPALPESMDFYFIDYDSGLINIDGLDSKVGRADRVLAAKERLPEQFEKYDRSAELAAK